MPTAIQPSNEIDLAKLIDCADNVIRTASRMRASLRPAEGERGGYLVVHEVASNSVELILRLGPYNPNKAAKCIELALEKAARLHLCIRADEKSFASYETRDEDKDLWGGAIRANTQILSFSGLPELWDEAAMLVLAIRMGYLEQAFVFSLISEERNPHLRPLQAAVKWAWLNY